MIIKLFTNLIEALLARAKEDAQLWEGLLSATGGELELKKYFYYVLSWKWDSNGNPIPETISEQNLELLEVKMTNSNTNKEFDQKEVLASHKTLGTYKCFVDKETEQFDVLIEKSEKITNLVKSGQQNKRQSWLAYSCYYIPKMVYSLTAVSMNDKQLTIIQKKQQPNSRECADMK
jgi:hypothetical protein